MSEVLPVAVRPWMLRIDVDGRCAWRCQRVRDEGECLKTYRVKRCELLDLVFATLELGIELCDDLVR
jgi:hypothetical protein